MLSAGRCRHHFTHIEDWDNSTVITSIVTADNQ